MKHVNLGWRTQLGRSLTIGLLSAAAAFSAAAADDGFAPLSAVGEPVMRLCNPNNLNAVGRCRVAGLPGEAGFTLVASRSAPIIKNDVTVGTLTDRVWRNASSGDHIFGMRVQMNANAYDLDGAAFNVNDLFRQVLANRAVAIGYSPVAGSRALAEAGRTVQGLNEEPVVDPDAPPVDPLPPVTRDNGWVDFRIDANAAEPVGRSFPASPWLLVRTKAPRGFSVQPFAVRVLNSDFEDSSQFTEVFMAGYQPN